MAMTDARHLILVVDDSDEQFEALRRAFRRIGIANPVRRCGDGDEALDYLFRRGDYAEPASAPRPAVVLLDLNLPGTDGREVLGRMKAEPCLRSIPVVVLTTSSNPGDIRDCYRTGAAGFVIKPVKFDEFLRTVERLKAYWLDTVALPPE
jgi:CheY-like chemotaxis protein